MRIRRTTAALVLLASTIVFACREAAEPFRPIDRVEAPDPSAIRLTFGSGDDRTPAWSGGGDTIYFTTTEYEANPLAPATVLAVPADGMGAVTPLLRNVQEGTSRGNWISAAAISAEGDRVAFIHVLPLLSASPCVGTRVCPTLDNLPMVRLVEGEVHARSIHATSGLAEDVVLPLHFDGHSLIGDPEAPSGAVTVSEYHPFQYQFEAERRAFFRPSWSPGGAELAVSDGLRLYRWTLGTAAGIAIPGTADGMVPAWSPTGEWIAFARYARTSSETFMCEYQNDYDDVTVTDCLEQRIIHYMSAPEIVLVRPDGSEMRVLGEGTDPAWSPDGEYVYASADTDGGAMIVRFPVGGGAALPVPRTEGGIEPAVSPDGSRLAFARAAFDADLAPHDIWIIELP